MAKPNLEHQSYIPNDYTLYWPLNEKKQEIRLLRIKAEPANSNAEVVCYLTYASLLDPRVPNAYTCLSYCWGDITKTKEIKVVRPEKRLHDGTCEGKIFDFRVTANLEAALRSIRSLTARPLVWADAVCINQSNLVERAHQVSIMQYIYSKSMQTLIWLGDAEDCSDAAMDFAILIRRVLSGDESLNLSSFAAGVRCNRLRGLLKGELNFAESEASHKDFIAVRDATQGLLRRPWFRRVWVLQEVSKSSSVVAISGQKACQWEDIRNLGIWENRITLWEGNIPGAERQLPTTGLSTVLDAARTDDLPEIWWFLASECRDGKLPSILELIFRRTQIQASDPRDQVFALFGIARECQGQFSNLAGFTPDYSKTTAQVYTDFTRAVITSTKRLEVLSAVNTFLPGGRHRDDLPSWVPEYDHHFNLRRSLAFLGSFGYDTTVGTSIEMEDITDPNSLLLYGVVVDIVRFSDETQGEALQMRRSANGQIRNLIFNSSMTGIKDLWIMIANQKPRHAAGEDLLEAFVLTLICCRQDQRRRTTSTSVKEIPSLVEDFAAYWKSFEPDFKSLPSDCNMYKSRLELELLSSTGSSAEFEKRLLWTCDSRRLLITQEHYMGLFPRKARSGDLIVVFFGSKVPFVVRPIEGAQARTSSLSCYELVGECYVHGRMDGSVIEELDNGSLQAQLFDLR
ncbi:hypothetical protein H2198_003092 [Neophaeococcomyces mojaviensis]|uniref:Uncharacterized protein n=1 Tax=Neophaeococcomyces mojaviensis TaxID=3383035 RepID=A0ACC3ACC9_9EURO|nr:hypothetical protein H2198_003092 [Knufia sp. JES_112]